MIMYYRLNSLSIKLSIHSDTMMKVFCFFLLFFFKFHFLYREIDWSVSQWNLYCEKSPRFGNTLFKKKINGFYRLKFLAIFFQNLVTDDALMSKLAQIYVRLYLKTHCQNGIASKPIRLDTEKLLDVNNVKFQKSFLTGLIRGTKVQSR